MLGSGSAPGSLVTSRASGKGTAYTSKPVYHTQHDAVNAAAVGAAAAASAVAAADAVAANAVIAAAAAYATAAAANAAANGVELMLPQLLLVLLLLLRLVLLTLCNVSSSAWPLSIIQARWCFPVSGFITMHDA